MRGMGLHIACEWSKRGEQNIHYCWIVTVELYEACCYYGRLFSRIVFYCSKLMCTKQYSCILLIQNGFQLVCNIDWESVGCECLDETMCGVVFFFWFRCQSINTFCVTKGWQIQPVFNQSTITSAKHFTEQSNPLCVSLHTGRIVCLVIRWGRKTDWLRWCCLHSKHTDTHTLCLCTYIHIHTHKQKYTKGWAAVCQPLHCTLSVSVKCMWDSAERFLIHRQNTSLNSYTC